MNAPSLLTSRAPRQSRLVTPGWKKPTRSALASALAGFVLLLACSRQGEGDRCSTENDDNDCESGLICIEARDLRSSDGVPRCCPPDGEAISDGRCTRLVGGGSSTTTGGGGQAGESSVATNTTGGSCTHNSQCPTDLVCGPQGLCQPECLEDRDCTAPLICSSNNRCVSR